MEDKIWLVKSSYRIMGPYTHNEVCDLIKEKKISILDEVRTPDTRWGSAREKVEFLDFIKQFKNQDNYDDATMTQSIARTKSILTKTDHIPFREEMTPTPFLGTNSGGGFDHSEIQDASVISEVNHAKDTNNYSNSSYGSLSDEKVKQKIQKESSNLKFILIGLIVFVVLGTIGFFAMRTSLETKEFDRNISEAIRLKEQRLYVESLNWFERASRIKNPDEQSLFKMSLVKLALKGSSTENRRLYDNIINSPGTNPEQMHDAMLARALTYMYDGDYKRSAFELDKLMAINLNDQEAKLNKAMVSFLDKKYLAAYDLFSFADFNKDFLTIAQFGRVVSAIELFKENPSANTHFVDEVLKKELSNKKYLRRSMLLVVAFSQYLKADFVKMNEAVQNYLSEPLELSRKFAHPINIYWNFFDGKILNSYCKELVGLGANGASKTLYYALKNQCLFESGQEQQAEADLKDQLTMTPQDLYLKLTQVQFLLTRNQDSGAEVVLKSIDQNTNLKSILNMELCMRKNNINCLGGFVQEIQNQRSSSPYEDYYLAQYYLKTDNPRKSYEIAERSLEKENNFTPLLELRNTLESRQR